jgi:3'-5' exoribonuclease
VKNIFSHLNTEIDTYLLVRKKELRKGKKDYYLRLEFVDATGQIVGNVWSSPQSAMDGYQEGDIVKVRASVESYKDQLQLNVKKIRKAEDTEFDMEDFTQRTRKNVDMLTDELFAFIESVNDAHLHELLTSIFDDKEICKKFILCPAAKSWHHNYINGLLEHTISVVKICDFASKMYPINRDELIAGAILHDFGKIFEYTTFPVIDFTDEGRLIGHILAADDFVTKKASQINLFPTETLMRLRHMIISHHGELERGSVKVPQTLEAVILHFADNMDAQTTGYSQLIDAATNPKARWTEYDSLNNRYIFIGNRNG